jgi:predicted RNA-binding Zn ribbon-like protein
VLPFEWVGGDPVLDFNNTVGWGGDGLHEERLVTYPQFIAWAREAGLIRETLRLRRRAVSDPRAAVRVVADAHVLRAVLHAVLEARAAGRAPRAATLAALDVALRPALAAARIVWKNGEFQWQLGAAEDIAEPLRRLAWVIAQRLTSWPDAPVRLCANLHCGWVFIDQSRRRNRRWCDMRVCGSRQKARSHYARLKMRQRMQDVQGSH